MKNIIEKIKRKDNIVIFILFFLISLGITLNISVESNDEIWNFQNVYKMYNGFKIYEEINVIITPLFFWISEAIFHILGANLCIFRLSNGVMMAILFLYTYKILKKLQLPKALSLLAVFFIILQQFFILIRVCFNYNTMALLFFVIGVYYLIEEKTRKNVYIQAIITILIILTKQNIGIYYLVGNLIYLSVCKDYKKEKLKKILTYISVILAGAIVFITYFILDNNLWNFFNYTFGGVLEFANENLNFDISAIIFMISVMMMDIVLSIFFTKKMNISDKQKENIKILLIFSVMLSILCYPIFNWTHIIIGTYLSIINIVYMLYIVLKDFEKGIQKVTKIVDIIIILGMLGFSSFNMYAWIYKITSDDYPYSWEDPFFGGMMEKEEFEKNEKVIQYIEESEKDVVVLSYRAALCMIPLERNNGDFDLPFKGNLGIKGEDGLIEKVDNLKNVQFLIYKNKDERCYQESEKVKEYVKNTKKYVGEIADFEIYE